jgi:hypothetical protein
MLTKVVMKQNLKVCCQIAGMVARRQRDPLWKQISPHSFFLISR